MNAVREKISSNIKNIFINSSIILIILIGIQSILIGYNHQLEVLSDICHYYEFARPETLQLHRTVSIIIGFVLILIGNRLFKKMKTAWIISIIMVTLLVFMNILISGSIFKLAVITKFIVLAILVINSKEFKRASDPVSLKNSLILGLSVLAIIILNICLTIYTLKIKNLNANGIDDAIKNTLKMLFLIDPSVLGNVSKTEIIIANSSIAVNWIGIIVGLIFVFKPLVYQPIVTAFDREKVRKLLWQYGCNPVSYVSLENDKKYFFGKEVEGVIPYVIAAGVAVCVGDPVCSDVNMPFLIFEFITYCKQNDLDICFCNTLGKHIALYNQLGFSNIKCGEEAMFDLETYNLTGGRAAKIRNAINHATSLGVKVEEYKPLEHRDKKIEHQMQVISRQWLENKKSSELSFMLGTISLDNPMDRRYFLAYDGEENIIAFIVFTPFEGGRGYYADVTRRKKNAPIGAMEKITIEAFKKMKSEGVKWGSLGVAPLVNVAEDGKMSGKLLEFIYEKFNNLYGFKTLHHYKKKYGCTLWEPRYFVYHQKMLTPKIAYSIIKAQNPKGVSDFILVQLKSIFTNKYD